MRVDDLPPDEFPRYGATRVEHLAWIERSANSLIKEWRRLKAAAPSASGKRALPDDLQQAAIAAMVKVRSLCESVAMHLPEVARCWPVTKVKGYPDIPDRTLGLWVGNGGWADKVDCAVAELKQIIKAARTGKPLAGREYEALRVLYEHKAFSQATRIPTKRIAKLASGTTAGNYKSVIPTLRRRGLVETGRGAGSGVWLTREGRAECERLFA